MNRANDQSDDGTQSLRGDCFAGAYTASVILGNRAGTSSFHISPGDLDEAITALLVFRGDGDTRTARRGFRAHPALPGRRPQRRGFLPEELNRYPSDE